MTEQNQDFMEAFDELAKSYEDPSRPEPSFEDITSEPEDSSEEENVESQSDDEEDQPSEDLKEERSQSSKTTELPLNYKELYEKAKRHAEAQNNL